MVPGGWGLHNEMSGGHSCYGFRSQHIKSPKAASTTSVTRTLESHSTLGNLYGFASFCPAAPRGVVIIRRENLTNTEKKGERRG